MIENPGLMGMAPVVLTVAAPRSGWVARVDARWVASAALALGAGRVRKEDSIDHTVGVLLHAKGGARVCEGDVLAEVHAADQASGIRAVQEVLMGYSVEDRQVAAAAPMLERWSRLPGDREEGGDR